jgi:GNAT superfamily N-acetyltransferase
MRTTRLAATTPTAGSTTTSERSSRSNCGSRRSDGSVVGFTGALEHDGRWELEPIVVDERHRAHGVGSALVAALPVAARDMGRRSVLVNPVARNTEALRFLHAHGFDVLGRLELILDLTRPERWRDGERVADREFRV